MFWNYVYSIYHINIAQKARVLKLDGQSQPYRFFEDFVFLVTMPWHEFVALLHHSDDKASWDWNMFSTLITIDPMELANLPPLDAYGSEDVEFDFFHWSTPFAKK